MTKEQEQRLRFVRQRIARIKRLQRTLDRMMIDLDREQSVLAVIQWERDFSYKLRSKASQFTETDAAQLTRLVGAIRL